MENGDFTMVLGRFGWKMMILQWFWQGLGGGEAARATTVKANATETSGAQAKLMHRVAGGLWMR